MTKFYVAYASDDRIAPYSMLGAESSTNKEAAIRGVISFARHTLARIGMDKTAPIDEDDDDIVSDVLQHGMFNMETGFQILVDEFQIELDGTITKTKKKKP